MGQGAGMTPVAAPPDLRALTTLRFFAAAWVVLFTAWPHLDAGFTLIAVTKGYLGVETFFVLSGFILSHVYLQTVGEKGFSYKGFLWARVARVYPLHLLTLGAMVTLGIGAGLVGMAVDPSLSDWRALPAHLTMTHAWGLAPSAAFNHPSWSISAEWFAYLTFPVFAWVAWRARERPASAVLAAATGGLVIYAAFERLAGFPLTEATFRWGALRIAPCFALGCALYLAHRRGPLAHAGWVAAAFALLTVALASLRAWDPLVVLCAGGTILGMAGMDNDRAGFLSSRVGVYLGEISYSIYMVCAPVLLLATNLGERVLGGDGRFHVFVWLAMIAAIVVAASLTYHLVERPARKVLRGLTGTTAQHSPATKPHTTLRERVLQSRENIV